MFQSNQPPVALMTPEAELAVISHLLFAGVSTFGTFRPLSGRTGNALLLVSTA